MEVFKMKKLLLICSLLFTFALVGCSSKPTVKDVPVNDIKESILSKNLIDIPFNEIDAKDFYVFESIKDKIDDIDASPRLIFKQWITHADDSGIPIPWEDLL